MSIALTQVVLGALAVLVPGGLFAALRYKRDDDGDIVAQGTVVTNVAVVTLKALRDELEHTREDLIEERDARRELATEVRQLRDELTGARSEVVALRLEIADLRGHSG